ncbi:MAG TPA: hypothetical protein DEO70_06180 [Bacteroidales bacterium]|nr:MAG: hypothetical protein A2X11_08225 [Bacteroidetes bacterium GWE2_42_24]OFY31108.1 MAG: hypothetical protein A2X09_15550 [Bacteroidetes bacterium GWF2_43_11]HBZ66408.1 hypothetical protein [Bacteroidales bacterium]
MRLENDKPEDRLGKDYSEHSIFVQLQYYSDFYDSLSFAVMNWSSMGTKAILNLDTFTFSSIKGTIDSIKEILQKGRINDSYALLRKYYDSTMINIYANLYLSDNFSLDNFIVTQIDNWRQGSETIPEYRVISKYIKDSPKLKPITDLLKKDDRYQKIRDRCNDHTHYNFYRNLLLNDNVIYNPNRVKHLGIFSKDIDAIFIQHFAYIFYLNEHYMMASDYMDSLEVGIQPEEDSQYWVSNFVQKAFDDIIKAKRFDIAEEMKRNTNMQLN